MTSISTTVLLVGDEGVGKESMCHAFYENKPLEELNFFIPMVFHKFTKVVVIDGCFIDLCVDILKDTENYQLLVKHSSLGAVLLCFSVFDQQSLKNVTNKWLPEVKRHFPKVPIVLVGTKSDKRTENLDSKVVLTNTQYASALAREIGACAYIECSAFYFTGIEEVFNTALHEVTRKEFSKKKSKIK